MKRGFLSNEEILQTKNNSFLLLQTKPGLYWTKLYSVSDDDLALIAFKSYNYELESRSILVHK